MESRVDSSPAALEARRLRSALRKTKVSEGPVLMVVTPQEQAEIWAELTPRERERVTLLTSWPWSAPALASSRLCRAA